MMREVPDRVIRKMGDIQRGQNKVGEPQVNEREWSHKKEEKTEDESREQRSYDTLG